MAITLNHTIVPARDKAAAARFFLPPSSGSPMRVDSALTFDFADAENFESRHYAFHVDDAEFDAILSRVQSAGIPYASDPWHLENRQLNAWNGGRGFYFRDPDRHILEVLTRA